MAELDTRLPLALQPAPFPDARQVVGDLLNARAARQQGTLNDLLIEKAQRDQAQEADRRAAFAQFGQAQGGGTLGAAGQAPPLPAVAAQAGAVPAAQVVPGGTLPGLMQQETQAAPGQTLGALGGAQQPSQRRAQDVLVQRLFMTNPEQALQMQEFFNTQDVAKLEQNKLQLETLRTSMSVGGQLLSGVDDQASYDLVKRDLRRIVQRMGRNPALVPDLYTPETVEQLRSQASDLETQASQLSTETDQKIDTLKAETAAGKLALEQEKEQRKVEDVPRQRDIEERETRAREMQAQAAIARAGEAGRGLPPEVKALTADTRTQLGAAGLLAPGVVPTARQIQTAQKLAQENILAQKREEGKAKFANRGLSGASEDQLGFIDILDGVLSSAQADFQPEFSGFFTGRVREWKQKVAGETVSDQEARWRQSMDMALELFSRAQSGAAINAGEMRRFRQLLPNANDAPNILRTKAQGMRDLLREMRITRLRRGTMTRDEARQEAGRLEAEQVTRDQLRARGATEAEINTVLSGR